MATVEEFLGGGSFDVVTADEFLGGGSFQIEGEKEARQQKIQQYTQESEELRKGTGTLRNLPGAFLQEGIPAGGEAITNLPSSMLNFAKGFGKIIANPAQTVGGIGQLLKGAGAKAGQKTIEAITGQKPTNEDVALFDAFAGELKSKYGSLENFEKYAREDPFSAGFDLYAIAGGVAKITGQTEAFARATEKVGGLVTKPIKGAVEGIPTLLKYPADVPEKAYDILLQRRQPVVQAIKAKNVTPETVLRETQGAVRTLRGMLTQQWDDGVKSAVSEFHGKRMALNSENQRLLKLVERDFGIVPPANTVKMSIKETTDLMGQVNELLSKPLTQKTAQGVPIRKLHDALKTQMVNTFGGKGGTVDKLYANYSAKKKVFDAANDIVRAYQTGKPIAQSTALGRLKAVFNENKGAYLDAIIDLEKETKTDLLSKLAGTQFRPILPTKIKAITAGGGLSQTKSIAEQALDLIVFPLSSPRSSAFIMRNIDRAKQLVSPITTPLGEINRFEIPGVVKKFSQNPKAGLSIDDVSTKELTKAINDVVPRVERSVQSIEKVDDLELLKETLNDFKAGRDIGSFGKREAYEALRRLGWKPGELIGNPSISQLKDSFVAGQLQPNKMGVTSAKKAQESVIREKAESLFGSSDDLIKEARKYKSADEFVKVFEKRGFNPFGVDDTKIPKADIELHGAFMKYAEDPKIQKIYEQGGNDTQVLTDIWNKANTIDRSSLGLSQNRSKAGQFKSGFTGDMKNITENFVKQAGDQLKFKGWNGAATKLEKLNKMTFKSIGEMEKVVHNLLKNEIKTPLVEEAINNWLKSAKQIMKK